MVVCVGCATVTHTRHEDVLTWSCLRLDLRLTREASIFLPQSEADDGLKTLLCSSRSWLHNFGEMPLSVRVSEPTLGVNARKLQAAPWHTFETCQRWQCFFISLKQTSF